MMALRRVCIKDDPALVVEMLNACLEDGDLALRHLAKAFGGIPTLIYHQRKCGSGSEAHCQPCSRMGIIFHALFVLFL